MKIAHGHLVLETIQLHHLELIRSWRNDIAINRYLIHRHEISLMQQRQWYNHLDYATSIYFVIKAGNKEAGLVYATNISQAEKSFEGGVFIGESTFRNSYIPVKAILLLSSFFFDTLQYHKMYSTVHSENLSALDMDKLMGFKELNRNDFPFVRSSCTAADFNEATRKIRKALLRDISPVITYQASDVVYTFATSFTCLS